MTAFVRRFREIPSVEELLAIEQIALIDRTPRMPVVGVGTGTMLLIGEFEDGDFNVPTEVFGENDEFSKFGGFGYVYGDVKANNPSARRHNGEDWNGNGFLKGLYLKPRRKIICRVDTSCGDVRFTLAAGKRTSRGPWSLQNGDQLSVTTDTGGPVNCTAVAATAAQAAGVGFPGALANGDQITIAVDGLPAVTVTFQATDLTRALACARINSFMGYTCAVDDGANIDINGVQLGTGGRVVLADVVAGTLAKIGHVAGTSNGGGNVANAAAVTPTEIAALINIGGIIAINGAAMVDAATNQVVIYRSGSAAGTIRVDDVVGAMATDLGLTTGAAGLVTANIGAAFSVPAGTRIRNAGGEEWVTMRTISWPEGTVAAPNTASQDVEVRANDETVAHTGAVGGTVTVEVDLPSTRMVEVTNPSNLTASPLSEIVLDARYEDAFDATLDPVAVSRFATDVVCARNSATVKRIGRQNAIDASDEGCYGRRFYARGSLGWTSAQAIADVALYRSDRVFYTWPGWQLYVSEIAERGAAGGAGFTEDGIIDIGADGPLAYLNCRLNPEENPCQDTGLLTFVLGIDSDTTEVLSRLTYQALKAAGICSPRVNGEGTPVYQSEVTADLTVGRTTQKRRKMADFLQDSFAKLLLPYSKKLATDARRAGIDAALDQFLSDLLSERDPQSQRIGAYSVTDISASDPDKQALGIEQRKIQVRMLSSMDVFVVDTEIGEGVVITETT